MEEAKKGTRSKRYGQPKPLEGFKARAGLTLEESIANNASNFMNSIWKKIEEGDEKATELMFGALTREVVKNMDMDNPLAGLPELRNMSLEDLIKLEKRLTDGKSN